MGTEDGNVGQRLFLRFYGALPRGVRQRSVRAIKPSFTVSVMPVVTAPTGAILLVRHSYVKGWGLPGGLVNRRERMALAIARETREEVGIKIELVGEPTVTLDPNAQVVRIIHRVVCVHGESTKKAHPASPEIAEVRWFMPDQLPTMLPESIEAIEALQRAEQPRH